MQRERITDDIYVFTSELYAQVTAGVIVTSEGAVVIDTLVYPQESIAIRRFVHERLDTTIKYVVNTHFHADHTTGTCFFNEAKVIAHEKCRQLLLERGRESLENARTASPDMHDVSLVLPDITFDDQLTLHMGNKTLKFRSAPGHSPDLIVCSVEEDQVLFASDALMPIPYFVDGSYDDFVNTLKVLQSQSFESIVQGHGEIILRGEVKEKLAGDLRYLELLGQAVDTALKSGGVSQALKSIDVEACGKSRILLNGTVQQLHQQNVLALAEHRQETISL